MSDPQESAGSSTDQHITGRPETGDFITDKPPAADTPVHGSSNAGLDDQDAAEDSPGTRTTYE